MTDDTTRPAPPAVPSLEFPDEPVRIAFTAPAWRAVQAVHLLLNRSRYLQRRAEREGFVPAEGQRNRNASSAAALERTALAIVACLPADVARVALAPQEQRAAQAGPAQAA